MPPLLMLWIRLGYELQIAESTLTSLRQKGIYSATPRISARSEIRLGDYITEKKGRPTATGGAGHITDTDKRGQCDSLVTLPLPTAL